MVTAGSIRSRKKKASEAGRGARKAGSRLAVGGEERQHLIEACAFFHADHFRPAEPGSVRAQDLKEAAAEIDAVLKRRARKGDKR
jgi:hypothetical protein